MKTEFATLDMTPTPLGEKSRAVRLRRLAVLILIVASALLSFWVLR